MDARHPRRRPARRLRGGLALETLESRDCPATVGIAGGVEVIEGRTSVPLTISLSEPVLGDAWVSVVVGGTATGNGDYRLSLGSQPVRGRVLFTPGETTKTIDVAIVPDAMREPTESVVVSLVNPVNCTLGSATSTTVAIVDDDSYTATLLPGTSDVSEGETAYFSIQLSAPATRPERFVANAIGGTATSGKDFATFANRTVTIPIGATSAIFGIPVRTDGVADAGETFQVSVRPLSPGMPRPANAVVTITESGLPNPPTVSVSGVTVTEGDAGTRTATFQVSLSWPTSRNVTVAYATADGTATVADADYVAAAGTVLFTAGQQTRTVSVTINGDRWLEADELLTLALSNPVNATLGTSTATCTITNDEVDAPGFQIRLNYMTAIQPAWQAAIEKAVAKWQAIIVGDIPSLIDPLTGFFVDDFEMDVYVEPDDPSVLGWATAVDWRSGVGGLPFYGEMSMNSLYANDVGFYDTVLHELAHALGFDDVLWEALGLYGGTTADPRFLGANALREYNQIFGVTESGVPLYEVGSRGDGSYGVHWRDSLFGNETMVSAGDPAQTSLLSRITVGAFQDIGYTVDYGAADAFTKPTAAAFAALAADATGSPVALRRPRSTRL